MVRLVPMTETEFQAYLADDIERYAQEHVRMGNWHSSEALQKSKDEHQRLLPDGLATQNHYFFSIEEEQRGAKVGTVWFAVHDDRSQAFVYDFLIYEEYRRQGYGTQTLLALEAKVKELGIDKIALHVFAHNHVARALYEKTGFEITGIYMTKKLAR